MNDVGYRNIIQYLAEQAAPVLKYKHIEDDVICIDYVAIFPISEHEHDTLLETLKHEGVPVKSTVTGTLFKLNQPIQTPQGEVCLVKISIYNQNSTQRGSIDYQVENYQIFRKNALMSNELERTNSPDGAEILKAREDEVLLLFPENPLGQLFI